MRRTKRIFRTILLYGVSLFLIAGYPLSAYAESAPATDPQTPRYSYDSSTQRWNTDKWQYNSATQAYEPVQQAAAPTPPPVAVQPPATEPSNGEANQPAVSGTPLGSDGAPSSGTGQAAPSNDSTVNAITNAGVANTLSSQASTGNAAVTSNTTAAHATTGNASAIATQTNIIDSSVSASVQTPASFVSDIIGSVYGDIMIYPMMLAAMMQSATSPQVATVSATTNSNVANDINLQATSGDATVTNNTTAGNATTGSANAMVGVMNIINSMVSANQSFVGTINIYGDLNGDILVAPDFIPELLASNGAQASSVSTLTGAHTSDIINNVSLIAGSGTATVAGNTAAGSATSGMAKTNTVILNLTGQQVVASNSLLVFVNILGTWVGMIVNAPAGATAAALGDGVTSVAVLPQTISNKTNTQLTNNITVAAQTGNATVAHNTTAGSATTGDATASAAILNIDTSTLGLSHWFGVLFINVFGNWQGSFGIDTPNGNNPIQPVNIPLTAEATPVGQIINFAPRASQPQSTTAPSSTDDAPSLDTQPAPAVLAATTLRTAAVRPVTKPVTPIAQHSSSSPLTLVMMLTGIGIAGAGWLLTAGHKYK